MNQRENEALQALLSSKKYGALCPDTVRRVFEEALTRHKGLKQADKAARAQLHQITGAYMSPQEFSRAGALLNQLRAGDAQALEQLLGLHASTRERQAAAIALYSRVFEVTGPPESILDLACGLNPLALGALGYRVHGVEVHGGMVALINEWAQALAWPVTAQVGDLLMDAPLPRAQLALMMKLMPVLEQQKAGAAMALLRRVPARYRLVTFPTRTLSGRRVGMERHYAAWFEANLPEDLRVLSTGTVDGELYYLVEGE